MSVTPAEFGLHAETCCGAHSFSQLMSKAYGFESARGNIFRRIWWILPGAAEWKAVRFRPQGQNVGGQLQLHYNLGGSWWGGNGEN